MSDAEFEEAVADALDSVPQRFLDRLDNVVFRVEREPTAAQRAGAPGSDLLGLYVGVALPDRGEGYGLGTVPDQIFLFSGPIERHSRTRAEVVEQVRVTVLHEIGHFFGLDDDRLHELGWG